MTFPRCCILAVAAAGLLFASCGASDGVELESYPLYNGAHGECTDPHFRFSGDWRHDPDGTKTCHSDIPLDVQCALVLGYNEAGSCPTWDEYVARWGEPLDDFDRIPNPRSRNCWTVDTGDSVRVVHFPGLRSIRDGLDHTRWEAQATWSVFFDRDGLVYGIVGVPWSIVFLPRERPYLEIQNIPQEWCCGSGENHFRTSAVLFGDPYRSELLCEPL